MMRDVLAPEISFLQLYKFCADMLSSKLAGGKVERGANGTMRRHRWITRLIVVSHLLGGRRLLLLLLRGLIGILMRESGIRLGREGKHGKSEGGTRRGSRLVARLNRPQVGARGSPW
jgi:hypothetical protein